MVAFQCAIVFCDATGLAPSSLVLEWLMASASRISRRNEFHEGQVARV